jgi:hypothetical protein
MAQRRASLLASSVSNERTLRRPFGLLPTSDHDHPPAPSPRPEDATLGGYFEVHDRPPAYGGPDGHPYTVSLEVERTANLRAPHAGYLVFPRWAQTGVGIVGHAETPTLVECASHEEALHRLGEFTLLEVQQLLVEAIQRDAAEAAPSADVGDDEADA